MAESQVTVESTKEKKIRNFEAGYHLRDHQGIFGVNCTLMIDGTDHLDIIHNECGHHMDINFDTPWYGSRVSETETKKKMMSHMKTTWIRLMCSTCNTGWKQWRKVQLDEEGDFPLSELKDKKKKKKRKT